MDLTIASFDAISEVNMVRINFERKLFFKHITIKILKKKIFLFIVIQQFVSPSNLILLFIYLHAIQFISNGNEMTHKMVVYRRL